MLIDCSAYSFCFDAAEYSHPEIERLIGLDKSLYKLVFFADENILKKHVCLRAFYRSVRDL